MPEDERLRLAVETTSLLGPRTGVGSMVASVLERLAVRPELDVTAVAFSWRGRGALADAVPPGVSTRSAVTPARLAHRLWQRVDWPRLGRYDVVHGPNFVVPPAGPAGAELITIHDFGPWHEPDLVTSHSQTYPRLVDRALGRGAHVHTVSRFVAAEATELLGLSAERIHVVENGFDPGPAGDPDRGRALVGRPYVLALGTIEPRKNLPVLVSAVEAAWADGLDHDLVIAGPDGWGAAALTEAIERCSAPDRIVRLGYVSRHDRSALLAGAGCLAFPSRYEGFGLPPLEAMAQGTPVVTTRAGALPEVCGDAARYVDVDDAGQLAAALLEVTGDQGRAASLVAAGRERVQAYSWDRTTDRLVDLYHQLAADRVG